jgi:hypothetical protein
VVRGCGLSTLDRQLEQDVTDGKLDALAEEAIAEFETDNYSSN